jgi:hypothetical protein
MAGTIKWQEGAPVTLTTTGASLTAGSAGLAASLDCRSGGTSGAIEALASQFSLSAAVAANTGIVAGTTAADLYLVPAIDGANFPDIDTTAGASYIPYPMRVGSFVFARVPTANSALLMQSGTVELLPLLYNVYIVNRSGQSINVNWTMKVAATAVQYT